MVNFESFEGGWPALEQGDRHWANAPNARGQREAHSYENINSHIPVRTVGGSERDFEVGVKLMTRSRRLVWGVAVCGDSQERGVEVKSVLPLGRCLTAVAHIAAKVAPEPALDHAAVCAVRRRQIGHVEAPDPIPDFRDVAE